ncbi:MAG: hypothetical protein JXP34_19295, partial [Planctomycetes bacterium]|nr:hypothetical protein [Planctomycetota bacterium]
CAIAGAAAIAYAAVAYALRDRLSPIRAALAIDERLALRERVTTAIWLAETPDVPADLRGAVARDAARRVSGPDLDERFPLRPSPRLYVGAGAVLAAAAIAFLFPALDIFGREKETFQTARAREELRKVERRIADRARTLADRAEDKVENTESKELFRELERLAAPKTGEERSREALVAELSRLEDRIKEQKIEYKPVAPAGAPAEAPSAAAKTAGDALREALAARDFAAARAALGEMKKELGAEAQGKGKGEGGGARPSEEDLERAAKALDAIARKLGDLEKLSRLLDDLASKIGAGDLDASLEGMPEIEDELERLERLADELALLEELLRDLEQGKLELASLPTEFCEICGRAKCPFCGKKTCDCEKTPGGT